MNRLVVFATTALAAAALTAAPPALARTKQTGEEKLAKILEGREAGDPVSCIPLWETRESRVIDKTAIVYGRGNTVWVNRPTNADRLDDNDVMVTDLRTNQLCNVDVVQMHDRGLGFFWRGFVGLQDFVPYRKVASAD
jgi:hypothetical protein